MNREKTNAALFSLRLSPLVYLVMKLTLSPIALIPTALAASADFWITHAIGVESGHWDGVQFLPHPIADCKKIDARGGIHFQPDVSGQRAGARLIGTVMNPEELEFNYWFGHFSE